jgi:hypothetical protein
MGDAGFKKEFLLGTLEDEKPLGKLRGNALVLNSIMDKTDEMHKQHIHKTEDAYKIVHFDCVKGIWWEHTKYVTFPQSTGLNINMMPIKLFDMKSIPENCKGYIDMIRACCFNMSYDPDTIAYLTIHESDVAAGTTQRRPGLHIESPVIKCSYDVYKFDTDDSVRKKEYMRLRWGHGYSRDDIQVGGIYMASSVGGTTRVWDSLIENAEDIADRHGCIECLRGYLGEGYTLEANELCWMTDCTPHESLPVSEDTHRQFFRLVVGKVDVWYAKHSTPNPLVEPDAHIVHEDKFVITP